MHPDHLDRFEEDPYWIAANARNLARLELEKYREAVNVHFSKPETPDREPTKPVGTPSNNSSIRNVASLHNGLA